MGICRKHIKDREKLKKDGVQIIAIEQDENSVDFKKAKARYPAAIILGTEVTGLEKKILKCADIIAEIPMTGMKESLNVAVAFGIAGYQIFG